MTTLGTLVRYSMAAALTAGVGVGGQALADLGDPPTAGDVVLSSELPDAYGGLRFTAAGDFAAGAGAARVLDGIAAGDSELTIALGDFSYGVTGQEQAWCDFVKSHVGEGYPFELLSGNHESSGMNGNINDFSACLPNQLPGLVGTYGREWYVDVPAEDPLVRFVMISPAITYPDGTWDYSAGTPRYRWTKAAIDGGRETGIPWTVVGIHKPCISLGRYACDIGPDIVNMLMAEEVDLVLMGHEHNYQRTHQLDLRPGCPALRIGGYDSDCVADTDATMTAGEGTVFSVIGTGGAVERDTYPDDSEAAYFAASAGAAAEPEFGYGDFTATASQLSMRFQSVSSSYTDGFTLTKEVRAPTVAPTASFTTATNALTASFDGAASRDPDGVVTTYDWDFGDGAAGGGAKAQHTYAAAGTYEVELTVTDDRGTSSSTTRQVTVAQPPPTSALALDSFGRTVAEGWGSAEKGGAWTTSATTAGVFSVGDGVGRVRLATAGAKPAPAATLKAVTTSDLDLGLQLSVSALPSGGRVDTTVTLRRRGSDAYRGVVRVTGTGAVQVGLGKTVAGLGTNLTTFTTVPGVTLAPGERLFVRAQATGVSPTTLRLKAWESGTAEPTGWQVTAQDTATSLQGVGYVGVSPYLTSESTVAPVVTSYDNLRLLEASSAP